MAMNEARETQYFSSADASEIAREELERLRDAAVAGPVCGLALSGGGIRSASFALGLMQALHSVHAFKRFDYLSTVSGGGYIGGAFTYFRNAFQDLGKDWFPFGYDVAEGVSKAKAIGARAAAPGNPAGERAQQIVNYLRQHASYLTPSRKFDRPALVAGVLRGLISTVLPYFTILAGFLGILVLLGAFDEQPRLSAFWSLSSATIEAAAGAAPGSDGDCPQADCPGACLAALCGESESCAKALCAALEAVAAGEADCANAACNGKEKTPPDFFLAAGLGSVGLWLAAATLFAFLISSILAGVVHNYDRNEQFAQSGYSQLIRFYRAAGKLLLLALALLCLATLPWVHAYLNSLWRNGGALPANFTALFGAIAGAAGLIGRLRNVVGGAAVRPSPLKAAGMAVAGLVFVYAFLLLGYGASVTLLQAKSIFAIKGWDVLGNGLSLQAWRDFPSLLNLVLSPLAFLGGLLVAYFVSINLATQHRIYRDRLMEVFCAEESALISGEWARAKRAQSRAGWLVNMMPPARPYHLINACLVTTDSNKRRYRGRGGDNFIMTPLFCGSDATGWVRTKVGMEALSLPTAIAVSGAALNAHAGPHGTGILRNKAYAAVLGLLGLNLGVWLPNPKRFAPDGRPPTHIPNLLNPGYFALSGRKLNETNAYVQLSDGGHFENLAIYELIRRKVDFLWISDAGQDAGFSFEDLANAIERVRVDFAVNLRFQNDDYDLSHLIPGSATSDNPAGENFIERYKLATRGYAIGTIEYPTGEKGVVVYVKSTLTRGLPGDIYGYRSRNGDYPHQTTLDQFFDEDQFEAYRELGYRLAVQLFRDIEVARKKTNAPDGSTGSDALDKVALALGV